MGSHRNEDLKVVLKEMLDQTREMSLRLEKLITDAASYDMKRQLKKVDAELIDFQHSVWVAIDMHKKE